MSQLSAKQARFCEEYLIDLNATQAAIRAGYSENTAYSIGHENLRKPDLQERIQKLKEERSKRTKITADRVLQELAKIGFADIRQLFTSGGHLVSPENLGDEIAGAVSSIEVVTRMSAEQDDNGNQLPESVNKIRLSDKKGSLELLGKHLNLFTDKIEVKHSVNLIDLTGEDAD